MSNKEKIMKKAISLFVSVALLFVMVSFQTYFTMDVKAETASENLVENGDIELGLNGWSDSKQVTNSIRAIDASVQTDAISEAHQSENIGGNYYLSSFSFNYVYQKVTLEPNQYYKFSMNYYPHSADAAVMFFEGADVNDTSDTVLNQTLPATPEWKSCSYSFNTSSATEYIMRIFTGRSSVGGFELDNVVLIKDQRYSGDVLNGNAENNNVDGWTKRSSSDKLEVYSNETGNLILSNKDFGTEHQKFVLNYGFGGGHYFKASSGSKFTQKVKLEPNTEYCLYMAYYIFQQNVSAVELKDDSGNHLLKNNTLEFLNVGSKWVLHQTTFTTNSNTEYNLGIYAGGHANGLLFDEVTIVKVKNQNSLKNGDFAARDFGWTLGDYCFAKNYDRYTAMSVAWGKTVSQNLTLSVGSVYKLSFKHVPYGSGNQDNTVTATVSGQNDLNTKTVSGYNSDALYFEAENDADQTISFTTSGSNYYIFDVQLELISTGDKAVTLIGTGTESVPSTTENMKGLRYKFTDLIRTVSQDSNDVEIDEKTYTIEEMGILFAAESKLDGKELTLNLSDENELILAKKITPLDLSNSDLNLFTGFVDNIDSAHLDTEIDARAYVKCISKDESAEVQVIYSNVLTSKANS